MPCAAHVCTSDNPPASPSPTLVGSILHTPTPITAPSPVRIINVASAAHAFGKIDFDSFRSPKDYKEWPVYGQR
jgi:hypothetical protein